MYVHCTNRTSLDSSTSKHIGSATFKQKVFSFGKKIEYLMMLNNISTHASSTQSLGNYCEIYSYEYYFSAFPNDFWLHSSNFADPGKSQCYAVARTYIHKGSPT